jgi:hypothetical protein
MTSNGPPSALTGPCLITSCEDSATYTGCDYSVQLCTAGSLFFDNPVDVPAGQTQCSYYTTDDNADNKLTCGIQELAGQLGHNGDSWSIFDAVSTMTLSIYETTVAVGTFTQSIHELTVTETGDFDYFLTAAAAETATAVVASTTDGSASTATDSSTSPTKGSSTAVKTTSTTKTTGTTTSGTQTSSGAAVATTTAPSGQNRLRSSKIGFLAVVGGLVWTICAA